MNAQQESPASAARCVLTHDEIAHVLGEVSDEKATAIAATGADMPELEEAAAWAAGESDVIGKLHRPLSGVVAQIYDILTADEDLEDERE